MYYLRKKLAKSNKLQTKREYQTPFNYDYFVFIKSKEPEEIFTLI